MWALRRASLRLRSQGFSFGAARASCFELMPTACAEDNAGIHESPRITCSSVLSTKAFCHTCCISLNSMMSRRGLSSQADTSSTKDDNDLEDELSELEETHGGNEEAEMDLDNDVEKPHNELELSDNEGNPTERKFKGRNTHSELFKAIINAPGLSVDSALGKWVEEGKELSRQEISLALINLRKHKMYARSLQLFQWLESNKKLEFVEKDYASQVDLVAKLRGVPKAEHFVERIPENFRGELVYRTVLANYVRHNNLKKAEQIFNKIKDLGLPVTSFACNQLLFMYKKANKKKIADVLLLMEKENVKRTQFTYKILADIKGQSNDIAGMEQIVETMKEEGTEPNNQIMAALARHYTSAGLKEKAEAILKDLEGENLKENLWVSPTLLRLYANLGKADEVERIWNVCKSKPRIEDCLGALEAWGKLNKIEEAEAVFNMMSKKWRLSSANYAALLKVYANHKMLLKGKDLIKRMADSGCKITPLTMDALVKLYVQSGEVEKADSVLHRFIQQDQMFVKPLFTTFMAIMEQYAKRGDVHNSEKIFHKMRQAGYISHLSQFQVLVKAYINAKMPAYGMRERMQADNMFPNKALAGQLVQVNGFRKTAISDLLE